MNLSFDPPLTHEKASCADMTLREPTAGNIVKAEEALAAQTGGQAERVRDATLIAAVSGVPIDLVRKMPASKFRLAADYLNAFDGAPSEPPNTDPELIIPVSPRIEKMGRIVDQVELREPTTGEVEEAQRKLTARTSASMRAMQIHLVALVAELPRPIIEALPISTVNQASRYLLGFT